MKNIKIQFIALCLSGFSVVAQDTGKTLTQNISASESHKFLAANINASGLSQTFSGKGPFTVFAPTDKAFEKSSAINVEKAISAGEKSNLQGLITYHVVAGRMDSKAIGAAIKAGNGKAVLTTLEGSKLVATSDGSKITISDEKGNKAAITSADLYQSNGVIHVIDKVLSRK